MSDYDKIAREYEEIFNSKSFQLENDEVANMLRPYIKGRVLDIGCGTGLLMDMLGDIPEYTGVDESEGMIKVFKEKYPKANLIQKKFGEVELGKFDSIISLFGSVSYLTEEEILKISEHQSEGCFIFIMGYADEYEPITHKIFNIDTPIHRNIAPLFKGLKVRRYNNYDIFTNK